MHRDQPLIGGCGADVVALQRHGCRQHDVGKLRHRRPGALVHDNGLRDVERAPQPVDVLVMMERVAARPIDQLDIGVLHRAAVVFERLPRIEQHVADARHRNEIVNAVLALRQRRNRHCVVPAAGVAERTERVIISGAGQADLAEHRREHRAHPNRLLAILRPLQRMRDRDQGAPARQSTGKIGDGVGCNAGNAGRPCRVLWRIIVAATQIAFEDVKAGAVARDKAAVPEVFDEQRVRERQHQRHVGADPDRQPASAGRFRHVVAQRRNAVEEGAAARGLLHRVALDVAADAAAGDIGILQRHAAECQHDIGMLGDLIPRHVPARDVFVAAEDVRQDHSRGAGAIAVHRTHIAAECHVQEAMNLALRVMETPGARPAIGAAEHRGRAIVGPDPR